MPDTIEFEWKEWPSAFPRESHSDQDLKNLKNYADAVRAKTQRKYAKVEVQNLIPKDVIGTLRRSEQAAESERSTQRSLKLFFIFMQDGLRFRWEQWHDKCIERYGGDKLDLPLEQLLSGAWLCDDPQTLR